MPLATPVRAKYPSQPGVRHFAPVSLQGDFITIHSDVTAADNSGNAITTPGTITSSTITPLILGGIGTIVELTVKYTSSRTLSTDPVLNLFGFDSSGGEATPFGGIPVPLLTTGASYAWTLADDSTNDPTLSGFKYTLPVQIDVRGLWAFGAFVKTAGVLSSTGVATLLARVY